MLAHPSSSDTALMAMFVVQYETEDPELREIIQRYLATDEQGRFLEDVSDIAADYGMTWKQVLSIVRSYSTIRSTIHRCAECGERKEFTSRKDIREHRTMNSYSCRKCRKMEHPVVEEESLSDKTDRDKYLQSQIKILMNALSDISKRLDDATGKLHGIRSSIERNS